MPPQLIARLGSLADATRARLLVVLARHELSVGELCTVLRLPQSTVSRHLRVLTDEGWLASRPAGTTRYYRLAARLDPSAAKLWGAVREELEAQDASEADEARALQVIRERLTPAQQFFASSAGHWDALREELFGARLELRALLALLDPAWVAGDLGCGTGAVSEALAPNVARVIAVDAASGMLALARRRLRDHENVELRQGELEALPIEDGALDVAVLSLVLHYLPEPGRALAEAARVVRAGGRVLVVDMSAHEREEYRERMGHAWLGFAPEQMHEWLHDVGFEAVRLQELAVEPEAKGPRLFTATARRRDTSQGRA
jgi:ArsR family transcriptional regulator